MLVRVPDFVMEMEVYRIFFDFEELETKRGGSCLGISVGKIVGLGFGFSLGV